MLPVQSVYCPTCQLVHQVNVEFADAHRSCTRSFERYVLELSRHMTIEDVALHLGYDWDMIKGIQKRNLTRRFAKPKLKNFTHIGIDEISVKKGHRYLTIVLNLKTPQTSNPMAELIAVMMVAQMLYREKMPVQKNYTKNASYDKPHSIINYLFDNPIKNYE